MCIFTYVCESVVSYRISEDLFPKVCKNCILCSYRYISGSMQCNSWSLDLMELIPAVSRVLIMCIYKMVSPTYDIGYNYPLL